ncbi:ECF-type sigma factor [Thalassoglobus sp. JC818]|uniref:ECF-type sigma factor n=1 Tax=Thalassoglobus sp. JC818 TaxID=3232136 RepID=UPI00345A0F5B
MYDATNSSDSEQLFTQVYDELRALAAAKLRQERPDHTLQATALVHEAYLRLADSGHCWETKAQFFAAAANSMQQILVNWAVAKRAKKRCGAKVELMCEAIQGVPLDPDLILDLEEAIQELHKIDAESAEIVKLRLYAGLSVTEAGEILNLSRASAYETWQFARAWFGARRKVEKL